VAAEGEPVVVDGGGTLGRRRVQHRLTATGVQVDDHQDVGAVGDHLVRDGLERGPVALGVLDVVVDTGGLERCLEVPAVGRLPADGTVAVRQDHADQRGGLVAAVAVPPAVIAVGAGGHGTGGQQAGEGGEEDASAHGTGPFNGGPRGGRCTVKGRGGGRAASGDSPGEGETGHTVCCARQRISRVHRGASPRRVRLCCRR